ncbi:MAG: helix-turn-helix transcriptional regulator [Bryobacteraceae bacterium]
MRQDTLTAYDPKPGISIATLSYEYPRGFKVPEHAHGSDQLIYAIRGVMEVSAQRSFWLIPPQFAIWVPARIQHQIRMPGAASMRTLYLRRRLATGMPAQCAVIHVGPLLRELILRTVNTGQLGNGNPVHHALRTLIVSELQDASAAPMFVLLPEDTRAIQVAREVIENISDCPPFETLCARAGASVRTIERAFRRDVGTSFEVWRRQLRVIKAIELLSEGCTVKEAAYQAGYRQSSAFVEMFRQMLGTTPRAWMLERQAVAGVRAKNTYFNSVPTNCFK